jgi:hypothetical protein
LLSPSFVTGALVAVTGIDVVVAFAVVGIFDGTLDGMSLGSTTSTTGVIVGSKRLTVGMSTISGIGANVNLVGAGTATGNVTGLLVVGMVERGDGIGVGIGACGCVLMGGGISNESVKAETSTTLLIVEESKGTMALFCNTDCSAS